MTAAVAARHRAGHMSSGHYAPRPGSRQAARQNLITVAWVLLFPTLIVLGMAGVL